MIPEWNELIVNERTDGCSFYRIHAAPSRNLRSIFTPNYAMSHHTHPEVVLTIPTAQLMDVTKEAQLLHDLSHVNDKPGVDGVGFRTYLIKKAREAHVEKPKETSIVITAPGTTTHFRVNLV